MAPVSVAEKASVAVLSGVSAGGPESTVVSGGVTSGGAWIVHT